MWEKMGRIYFSSMDPPDDGAHNVAEKLNYFAQNAIYIAILNAAVKGINYNNDLTNIQIH